MLSIRNSGGTDVGMDAIRFSGTDLELRPVGASSFSGTHLALGGDDLGDAAVIPPFTTRTVTVEVRSTTTVGHAPMGIDAEIYPSGYMSQIITGSDPDPGTGSISGHVTDAAGHPVRDLLVTAFAGGDFDQRAHGRQRRVLAQAAQARDVRRVGGGRPGERGGQRGRSDGRSEDGRDGRLRHGRGRRDRRAAARRPRGRRA